MYNHQKIENFIKNFWLANDVYHFDPDLDLPKMYILDMFPYPSGQGLHVGHPKGYTATDIYARFKRFNGFNVLHPIGWDAFGLPAEQYALRTGNHPATFTKKNITVFRKQLQSLGFSFDYKKEVNTTDPNYYKWTQWIFSRFFEKKLAEIKNIDVNWCPKLKTVLANEEVLIKNGLMVSERGEYPVVKRKMKQWILKITKYADRLINDLSLTDWPMSLKTIQTTWIGKSIGFTVNFKTTNNLDLKVFTTRIDTLYGVSFLAIAPENKIVKKLITNQNKKSIDDYYQKTKNKTILQRQENRDKTGIFTNFYAINPINNEKIPIYLADYVLNDYATGIVMGVASADKRDYEFAKKHKLKIIPIIKGDKQCITTDGIHINSGIANGLNTKQAKEVISNWLIKNKFGKKTKYYKLKDWRFSRQRYWGEPFPIIFDDKNKPHLVDDLPLTIPFIKNIHAADNGCSPLDNLKQWVNVTKDGKKYRRETNTMPQWAGSCWYYLAYLLKNDDNTYLPLNSPKAYQRFKKWLPVDVYVGGQEHAVLHLLYSRFWHKFLYDLKIVPTKEPFFKLINQGMILGPNGEKMSKSKGNVINPNEIVNDYGADALRIYEMFMGPITATLPWSENGLTGARKWLDRVYNYFMTKPQKIVQSEKDLPYEIIQTYHRFIYDVTNAIETYKFNIAISKMMVYLNCCYKEKIVYKKYQINFLVVLSCFAPFLAEYLYQQIINDQSKSIVKEEKWPAFVKDFLVSKQVNLPIQINGKLKATIVVNIDMTQTEIVKKALAIPKISQILNNKQIKKTIYVKNKIVNFIF